MNKQASRLYAIAATAGLFLAATSSVYPQQIGVPDTGDGSYNQFLPVGGTAVFSVDAAYTGSFQWLCGSSILAGQTNSTLVIENVQPSDAGYYSCTITPAASGISVAGAVSASAALSVGAGAVVQTISANLEVFAFTPGGFYVVYAQPITSSGSQPGCPGPYTGYVNYFPTNSDWGFIPISGYSSGTATDENRTNTKVQYGGEYGDSGCNKTTVTVPFPAFSPAYMFTIYFTNNVPTTNYPITLSGFNP